MPLFVINGAPDEVVPCSMAHTLVEASSSTTKHLEIIDGGMDAQGPLRAPLRLTRVAHQPLLQSAPGGGLNEHVFVTDPLAVRRPVDVRHWIIECGDLIGPAAAG